MNRIRAIAFAVAQINLAIMFFALVNGVLFFVYYYMVNDAEGFSASIKYLLSVSLLLFLWLFTALINRKYVLGSQVDLMITTALVWLTVPLSSVVIYLLTLKLDIMDAFFESVSGFTGTGLTILSNLDAIPYVILMWRAITQWLGELGTVVIAGVVLPYVHASLVRMYSIERGPKLVSTIRRSIQHLFAIYAMYTLLGVLILFLSGMEPLDAVIHSMTAIATGGMSSKDQSIGYWYFRGAQVLLLTSAIIMILGAQNFRDLYLLSKMRFREFISAPEVRGLFAILLVLLIPATALAKLFALDIGFVIYHLISGYTTTGFQVEALNTYPDALKVLIVLAMAIGGATFSTAGGIKIRRIAIAVKSVTWDIQKIMMPRNVVITKRLGREILNEDAITSAMAYIVLYITALLLLSTALHLVLIANSFTYYSFLDSLFETTSALSCVGLSVGITTASPPLAAKLILIIAMYFGRLEFLPLYLTIGSYYIKKKLPG